MRERHIIEGTGMLEMLQLGSDSVFFRYFNADEGLVQHGSLARTNNGLKLRGGQLCTKWYVGEEILFRSMYESQKLWLE